jgi:hypothetical protein
MIHPRPATRQGIVAINQEFTMEDSLNPNVVPRGPGGLPGLIFRMIVMICTGGMAFPNAFVEGMDCTAIQKDTEGNLYDKKPKP